MEKYWLFSKKKNPREKHIISLPPFVEARALCHMLLYRHMGRGDIMFRKVSSPGLNSVKINNNVWLGLLTKSYRTRSREHHWYWQWNGVCHNRKHFLTWWGSNCWSLLSLEAVQAENISRVGKALDIFMGSKSISTYLKPRDKAGMSCQVFLMQPL